MSPIYRKTAAKAWEIALKKRNTNFRENRTTGAFHSTTSGLNFQQPPVANGPAFSKFPKKSTTSRSILFEAYGYYTRYIFSRKFSFHSTSLLEFLGWVVPPFRKFNSFQNFWKLFRGISVPFDSVSKFSKVLVEWKASSIVLCFILAAKYRSSETGAPSIWCSTAYDE